MQLSQKYVVLIARARLVQARRDDTNGAALADVVGQRIAWTALAASADAGPGALRGRALWLIGWTLGQLVGQGFEPEEIARPEGLDAIEAVAVVAAIQKRRNIAHVNQRPRGPTFGGTAPRQQLFMPVNAGRPLAATWAAVYKAARTELDCCFDPAGRRQ
jgi:hypothetical protein